MIDEFNKIILDYFEFKDMSVSLDRTGFVNYYSMLLLCKTYKYQLKQE